MTIYGRPDEKVMAENAHAGEVVSFPDILRGWGIAFDQTGGIPPVEWFNALAKRSDQAIRYFMQRGLPEWSSTEDYPASSYVQYGGVSFISKRANTAKQPGANPNDWELWSVTRAEFDTATTGRLLNIQLITVSGVYTPSPGTKAVQAEVIAGGGAGGGVTAASAGQAAAGGGGGSGARGISARITAGFSGVAVTVGAGGVGVTGGSGASGGASSFGTFVSAPGGGGAVVQSSQAGPGFGQQGFGGSFPTGSAILISAPGWTGKPGVVYSSAVVFTGQGADTPYAQGGNSAGSSGTGLRSDGANGNGYGAGGSGGYATAGGAAAKGGNGANGAVIVYEFS